MSRSDRMHICSLANTRKAYTWEGQKWSILVCWERLNRLHSPDSLPYNIVKETLPGFNKGSLVQNGNILLSVCELESFSYGSWLMSCKEPCKLKPEVSKLLLRAVLLKGSSFSLLQFPDPLDSHWKNCMRQDMFFPPHVTVGTCTSFCARNMKKYCDQQLLITSHSSSWQISNHREPVFLYTLIA